MGRRKRPRIGRWCSSTGARRSRPRARVADYLSAQGSGLRARQTKGGPHAPENPTPTPAVNLRVNIEGLAKASKERVVFLSARMKGSRSSARGCVRTWSRGKDVTKPNSRYFFSGYSRCRFHGAVGTEVRSYVRRYHTVEAGVCAVVIASIATSSRQ